MFYTDSANGGQSKIIQYTISNTSINVDYDLKKGFQSPYIGLSIAHHKESTFNLTHYNRLHLNIEGQRLKRIGVSLFTRNPYNKSVANHSELCFNTNLDISPEKKQYVIDLDQLKIPDWCYEVNAISPNEKIKPDLNNVLHLNIGTAYTPKLGIKRTLRISSISLERNNEELILTLLTSELLIVLLLLLIHLLRAKFRRVPDNITITYKPVNPESPEKPATGFMEYINRSFQDSKLTLEQVSASTGVNQRRIANTILETYSCNFKTYVNQIRINESKRLLKESDLNMGEIAYKVGFNNQSHFNRVFKSIAGMSPTEFKEEKSRI